MDARDDWKKGWDMAWECAERMSTGGIFRWAITGAAVGGWVTMLILLASGEA